MIKIFTLSSFFPRKTLSYFTKIFTIHRTLSNQKNLINTYTKLFKCEICFSFLRTKVLLFTLLFLLEEPHKYYKVKFVFFFSKNKVLIPRIFVSDMLVQFFHLPESVLCAPIFFSVFPPHCEIRTAQQILKLKLASTFLRA